ncbi:MAG: class I SAM-dependent methyltransferase [Gammaproteobacteria bacterium]
MIRNDQVRQFWEKSPVAAEAINAEPGTPEFYTQFDRLREEDACEPYEFSNKIHGYEASAGLKVLDIGCGNGYVLSRYARNGAEVYGVDITEKALTLTKKRFELMDLPCVLEQTDGDSLPFSDNTFDIVSSMGVLHHIENPSPMVQEIHRVLKPGGRFILMLYYKWSWKTLVVLRLKHLLLPQFRGRSFQDVLNANDGSDCPLAMVYSKTEAAELLENFNNLSFTLNQLSWKQLFLLPGLGNFLGRFLPEQSESLPARVLGWNLYINCFKPE